MAEIIISSLPPAPNGTGSGTPKGTDLIPATDVTDLSSAATGTTKKYTRAATFNYMLTALGLNVYEACRVATTLAFTVTYNNGTAGVGATLTNAGTQAALVIDSVTVAVNDRILVKNQASQAQNGIYTVTNVGSASTNWVMTRATDFDTGAELTETAVTLVNQGSTYAGILFQESLPGPFTIGTTPIAFLPFNFIYNNFEWYTITGTSQVMVSNNGYFANNAALVSLQLPLTANVGDKISILAQNTGLWRITQDAGQKIYIGNVSSTTGVTGYVEASGQYDSVTLVCMIANTTWITYSPPQSAGLNIM